MFQNFFNKKFCAREAHLGVRNSGGRSHILNERKHMFTKYVPIISSIIISLTLFVTSCKKNDNPVSDGGVPSVVGPILFISDKSGSSQLYSMNEDGSGVAQITSDPKFPIEDAKWSPDGTKIAIVSLVGDDGTPSELRYAIFIMDINSINMFQVTQQWTHVTDSSWGNLEYGGGFKPVWSPDSKQIAYSRMMVPERFGNLDIFVINLDGSGERRITSSINTIETVLDWGGKAGAIAVSVMTFSSQYAQINQMGLDGAVLKTWANNNMGFHSMTYSSQDDKIALVVDYFPPTAHQDSIFIVNQNGDQQANIISGGAKIFEAISWSGKDDEILFMASNGEVDKMGNSINRILILNAEGRWFRDVTPFEKVSVRPTSWKRR